jgi:hypothetical protein
MQFPDKKYIEELNAELAARVRSELSTEVQLLMYSGALLNWVGDYVTDESIEWKEENININNLWLTGTNPEWNKIIIDACKRSPALFREWLANNPAEAAHFNTTSYHSEHILLRFEDEEYKVLYPMHKVIAAIRDGVTEIPAYIARPTGQLKPVLEPHVVYDLIRAYQRGLSRDRAGLVSALRMLTESFANVEILLRERFSPEWLPDEDIQKIIAKVLTN